MRLQKDAARRWIAVIGFFLLFTTTLIACGKHQAKDASEFEPGQTWLETMKRSIDQTIADDDRKAQLLDVIDRFEQELNGLDRAVLRLYEDLVAVDMNYRSTEEDFRKVFADFRQRKRSYRTRFIDLRFEMIALTTAEEWKKLADIGYKETLFLNWKRQPEIN